MRPTHAEVVKNTQYLYSAAGNVTTKKEFDGNLYPVTTGYEYDRFGNATKVTVTAGSSAGYSNRISQSVFDVEGRFVKEKTQFNSDYTNFKSEKFTYDAKWGKPLTYISNSGLTTSYQYDGFGRLTKTTLPEGYAITQTLNWENTDGVYSQLREQPGGGANVKTWYDILGREVKRQTTGFNNQWLTQTIAYDYKGNVVNQTKPYYSGETPITTTTQYDQYNRVTQVSNMVSTTAYSYTKVSGGLFKVTTTNGAGQSSSKTQDAAGRIKTANDNGGLLNYSYDSWGNQLTVQNAGGTTLIKNRYDAYGRQTTLEDRNAGISTYEYNGFGELIKQKDALNNSYTLQYDDFGRMVKRTGPEGITTYLYNIDASGRVYDDLYKVTGFAGEVTEYLYDNFRRPLQQKITVDGTAHVKQFAYDTYGNLSETTYPSGVVVGNGYDRNGTLLVSNLMDGGTTTTLFIASAMNSAGIYTRYTYGNGKENEVLYNATLGVPARYYTPGIQDLNFDFNPQTGNLNYRRDAIKNLTETFTYDYLNRLRRTYVNDVQQLVTSYDGASGNSKGNIVSKTDAGNYVYKTDKINAVAYITNPAGAQTPPAVISTALQQLTYTPFSKTASIDQNGYRLDYTYAADMERIKSVLKQNGAIVETKYYLGAMEVQTKGSITRYIHYINAGNGLCAIAVKENGVTKVYYAYSDYLGSILTLTDNTGAIAANQNFDAWGRYRNPDDWTYNNVPTQPAWLYRGFTSHEHLKEFALINMNGRMYDPVLGRMLSPDNYVPMPWNTQGYNRYGYANNNPLVYVDPDGNFFWAIPIIVAAVKGAAIASAVYVASNFIGGNTWNDLNFRDWSRAAGMGALGGGFGGAFSLLGQSIGALGQSVSYGIMQNIATQIGVDAAFGNRITFGSVFGSAIGGAIDGAIPQFKGIPFKKYGLGAALANAGAELAINTGRGALVGGVSSAIGGGSFEAGARSGAVGGFVRTGINIAVLGPTIRPTGDVKLSLNRMGADLGINLTGAYGPTYRAGGWWTRGLTVGRSAMINDNGEGVDDARTWVHESYHYYQQLTQGWAGQFTNGVYEQWWLSPFKGIYVYDRNYGYMYNESGAETYTQNFFK